MSEARYSVEYDGKPVTREDAIRLTTEGERLPFDFDIAGELLVEFAKPIHCWFRERGVDAQLVLSPRNLITNPLTDDETRSRWEAHRRLPERWAIQVCPECNGLVVGHTFDGTTTHTGDCPNRGKVFLPKDIEVGPAEFCLTKEEVFTIADAYFEGEVVQLDAAGQIIGRLQHAARFSGGLERPVEQATGGGDG